MPYPRIEISPSLGSFDFYRGELDWNSPLTEDESILARLNVAYENADGYRDFNENETVFIAPVITWQLGANTTLTKLK